MVAALVSIAARPGVVIGSPTLVQQPVEQQGGIVNPTACVWDVDDTFSQTASGRWEQGQTVTLETCVVADDIAHRVTWVSSFGNGCYLTHEYDHEAVLSLPAVGDGHGVITPITATVTNTARHPVKGALRFAVGPRWMECLR